MMTSKKTYLLLFSFITLIGCGNSQSKKSDTDFKNYFFQPNWFEVPKVYRYEFSSKYNDEKYNAYRYFEKIDNNQLKMTVYDKDFNQTLIIVYEYLPDKVILKKVTTVETWNNNKHVEEKLPDNVVFDYHKMNEDFGFTHTSRIKGYSDVTRYVTRNIKKTERREFNEAEVNVAIADGKTDIEIKTSTDDIKLHNDDVLIYAENIGVIYQESKSQNNKVVANLTRILTLDEFENMKNAR
ncbi:hypothetical protein ACE01N_20490 [Saccharicrinis sp. FJH2]|uniref:hypothetical protein n=1 Tax=Saccharicrinis sp. FJH65 TaxID=3344659 RepID=UPI0035F239D9